MIDHLVQQFLSEQLFLTSAFWVGFILGGLLFYKLGLMNSTRYTDYIASVRKEKKKKKKKRELAKIKKRRDQLLKKVRMDYHIRAFKSIESRHPVCTNCIYKTGELVFLVPRDKSLIFGECPVCGKVYDFS